MRAQVCARQAPAASTAPTPAAIPSPAVSPSNTTGMDRYPRRPDGTPDVVAFAKALESVCVEAVEQGEMTKDLALLISKDSPWLTTEDFLDALDRRLQAKMA